MIKKGWLQVNDLYDDDENYVGSVEIDWLHDIVTFKWNRDEDMIDFLENFEVKDM